MSTHSHPFTLDQPITKLEEDKLGRASFALPIAKAIESWKGDASLVLALYGGWGDGKSSVKGLVKDALKQDADRCPIFIEFSPWEWSGRNQLAEAFFEEIGKQLGEDQTDDGAKEAGQRLKTLGRYLAWGASLTRGLGFASNFLLPGIGMVTEAAAKGMKESGKLSEEAAEAMEEQATLTKKSLPEVKKETLKALKEMKRNILVFIDDVDRLTAEEISLLFQLVKANSDFPNLIFFLFFQRDTVELALEKTMRTGSGKEYLEKIVQVPLTIPKIQHAILKKLVYGKLYELLERHKLKTGFETERFDQLWTEGLSSYFGNLRDVNRFFGTFEFHLGVFPSKNEFNTVDLLALEVFRTFDAALYEAVYNSAKALFPPDLMVQLDAAKGVDLTGEWKKAIDQIASAATAISQEKATEILKSLFPPQSFTLGLGESAERSPFTRASRVAHPAFFNRYFQLTVPVGELSQEDVLELRESLANASRFSGKLSALGSRGLVATALERLMAFVDEFSTVNIKVIVSVFIDLADAQASEYDVAQVSTFNASAVQVINAHLALFKSGVSRYEALSEAIQASKGLILVLEILEGERYRSSSFMGRPPNESLEDNGVLEKSQIAEIRNLFLSRINEWASSGQLETHKNLKKLLSGWHRFGELEKAKDFCEKRLANREFVLHLLNQFLERALKETEEDSPTNLSYPEGFTDLEIFVSLGDLAPRVSAFVPTSLSKQQCALRELFTELWSKRTKE